MTATPSGQPSYNFPSLTGWSRSVVSQRSPPTHLTTDTTGSTNNPVTYFDGVSTSGPTTFDVVPDTTVPTAGGVTSPSGYDTTRQLQHLRHLRHDTGSDIQNESLQRYVKTLSRQRLQRQLHRRRCAGRDQRHGQPGADSSLSAGCYEWILTATDNVGNQSRPSPSSVTMVDPTAPSAPTLVSVVAARHRTSTTPAAARPSTSSPGRTTRTTSRSPPRRPTRHGTSPPYNFPAITGFTKSVTGATATYTPVAADPQQRRRQRRGHRDERRRHRRARAGSRST